MIKLFSFLVLLLLSSCSFDQGLLREIYNSYSQKDFQITSNIYNEQPYSFATFSIGNSNKIILILWKIDNDRYYWVSQDSQIITTYQGKIIEIIGFPNDFRVTAIPADFINKNEFFYKTDFYEPNLLGINAKSTFTASDALHDISLGFQTVKAKRFIEEYNLEDIKFSGENYYYFEDLLPRRTIQKVHPFLDEFVIEFFYK